MIKKQFYLLCGLLAIGRLSVMAQSTDMNASVVISFPAGRTVPSIPGLSGMELPAQDSATAVNYYNGWAENTYSVSTTDTASKVLVQRMFFDLRGRLYTGTKPRSENGSLAYTGMTYANYLSTVAGLYDSTFERIGYFNGDDQRMSLRMPYGSAFHSANRYTRYEYLYDTLARGLRTSTIDEDGLRHDVITNHLGQNIKQITRFTNAAQDLVTYFKYDIQNNLLWSLSPGGYTNRFTVQSADSILMPYGIYNDGGDCNPNQSGPTVTAREYMRAARQGDTPVNHNHDQQHDANAASDAAAANAPLRWERMEAPTDNPNHPVLRWYRPRYAIKTTVTVSHRADDGPCGYTMDLQYRVNGKGCWKNLWMGSETFELKEDEEFVEVRREYLQNANGGCTTPRNVFARIYTVSEVLDSARNMTNYTYDNRNRMITKISPDEGRIEYVYDNAGRLRFVQDEIHRTGFTINNASYINQKSYWTYYKYDGFGRMIEQGELLENQPRVFLDSVAQDFRLDIDTTLKLVSDTTYKDTVICIPLLQKEEENNKAIKSVQDRYDAGPPGTECFIDTLVRITQHWEIDTITIRQDTLYGQGSYPTPAALRIPVLVNRYDTFGDSDSVWKIKIIAAADTQTTLQGATIASPAKTRLTRSRIYDLMADTWTEEFFVYDALGRVSTRKLRIPELNANKKFQYWYDASGRVLKTAYQDGQSDSFYQWYRYDGMSRLDTVYASKTNNRSTANREAVYDYSNNNGGKVAQTRYGHNTLQTVDYTYTSRDWLKAINNVSNLGTDRFAMTLSYYDTDAGSATSARYNGNIRAIQWLVSGQTISGYDYAYDEASRLTDANFQDQNKFSEKSIAYDPNGNINTLTRHNNSSSGGTIGYTYDAQKPNRLMRVSGLVTTAFTYDANGNMRRDGMNSFGYDYRNMPIADTLYVAQTTAIQNATLSGSYTNTTGDSVIIKDITTAAGTTVHVRSKNGILLQPGFSSAGATSVSLVPGQTTSAGSGGDGIIRRIIRYAYDAAGQRIKMLRYDANGNLLDSSRIYVLNSNGKLMAEYVKRGSTWRLDHYNIYGNDLLGKLDSLQKRYYYLTDHLGSVRVTVKDTVGVPVDSWSDYYPFGKEARGSTTSSEPKEQFSGKQYDTESGLNYFGARYYSSEIARWISVDPALKNKPIDFQIEHNLLSMSSYQYVSLNPINRIDPDGNTDWWAFSKSTLKAGLSASAIVGGFGAMVAAVAGEGVTAGGSTPVSIPVFSAGYAGFAGGIVGMGESLKNMKAAWDAPDGMKAEDFSIIRETVKGLGANDITAETVKTVVDALGMKGISGMGEEGITQVVSVLEAAGATSEGVVKIVELLEQNSQNKSSSSKENIKEAKKEKEEK